MAEEEAALLNKRRAAELERLNLCGRRPFPMGWSSAFAKPVRACFDSAGAY